MKRSYLMPAAVGFLTVFVLVACGGGSATPALVPTQVLAPSTTSPTAGTPIPVPVTTPATQDSMPTAPSGWSTDTKSHKPAPNLGPGILFSTRTSHHAEEGGFDRIVFDFKGPAPGYEVKYVDQVVQDGSGNIVSLPGSKFYLEIRFSPAQAHYNDGAPALTPNQHPVTPGHPVLHIYNVHSDFEGAVKAALGLTDKAGFRVGTINGQTTSRFYVDVK